MSDDHLQPRDFGLDLKHPCPPCYDTRAKEFMILALMVFAFALGIAVGMKIRDGQLRRQQIEEATYK